MSTDTDVPADAPASGGGGGSPYKNLFVPLVVVPALIVVVLVMIFLLFGSIGGGGSTLAEDVERVMHGGPGERKQALFGLSGKVAANREAVAAGEELAWTEDPELVERVRRALAEADEDDYEARYVMSSLLAQAGEPEGVEGLLGLLSVEEGDDQRGELRFNTLLELGALGDPRATAAVAGFADHEDKGLRLMAVVALQNLPGEAALEALRGALDDHWLEVRGSAAISLSKKGDARGAPVLRDMLDAATYAAERANDAEGRRYANELDVLRSRIQAVQALGRLGLEEDRAAIDALAGGDVDPNLKDAALRVLADWGRGS